MPLPRRALDDCELLLSELVARAVRHLRPLAGATGIEVSVRLAERRLRVAVSGSGVGLPAAASDQGPPGWGLVLLDRLATRWGVDGDDGATVWFELDPGPALAR